MPRLAPASPLHIACLLLAMTAMPPAQERTPSSIVDGVVSAMCQKHVVLLGEQPSHGEALGFDAKSKIVDGLISRCGFTAVMFEMGVYDFVGFERALQSRAATQEQLDNAIGRF